MKIWNVAEANNLYKKSFINSCVNLFLIAGDIQCINIQHHRGGFYKLWEYDPTMQITEIVGDP